MLLFFVISHSRCGLKARYDGAHTALAWIKKQVFSWCTNLDTQRNFALVLTARLLTFLFTFFHPIATVSTSNAEFENYVFSRGGNRLIRTVLIASNGRTFFFTYSTKPKIFLSLSLSLRFFYYQAQAPDCVRPTRIIAWCCLYHYCYYYYHHY